LAIIAHEWSQTIRLYKPNLDLQTRWNVYVSIAEY
jgi:hypothetical protein